MGWELFRTIQPIGKAAGGKDLSPSDIQTIKRRLHTYLKLGLSGPDLLHSCMLQQASKLAHIDKLSLVAFAKIWNLENFRPEDYEEGRADDGKVFPSLVESIIQHASKEAAKGGRLDEMQFILPHAEGAMKRFQTNIWLKFNTAKLLRGLSRVDDARKLAIDFAHSKPNEYWTWELLGDLEPDDSTRLACYAKALTCSDDDDFVGKVRVKISKLLSDQFPGEAKTEIQRVIDHKSQKGEKIPSEVQQLAQCSWFVNAISAPTGKPFYNRFKAQAEDILFADLPWIDASIGDEFIIEGRDGQKDKKKRRIFVKANPIPTEISVAAAHPDVRGKPLGAPIRLRMETAREEPWRTIVHGIQPRVNGGHYDVVPELCGVIDGINHTRALLHFVVAKGIGGIIPLAQYSGNLELGATVAVRVANYQSRNGTHTRVISSVPTNQSPAGDVWREFRDEVAVRNGMGFTQTGIFVPPDLVSATGLSDGDEAIGVAVINFDKKKNHWGWKAIKIHALGE